MFESASFNPNDRILQTVYNAGDLSCCISYRTRHLANFHSSDSEQPHMRPRADADDVIVNAWLGPAGTISPIHTDPYHNIFAQV
jgi:hypothetical protein